MVTLCTPTFNRRPFFAAAMQCVAAQTYPRERMEWLIVDDGTDPVGDLFTAEGGYDAATMPPVRYEFVGDSSGGKKMPLGAKRNMTNTLAHGDILVYWDDDDYYPPTRVAHAVDMLLKNPQYKIAGTKAIHMYFADSGEIYRYGPYSKRPEQASAATFAFWRRAYPGRFDPMAALAEEESFTRNFTEPMLALDPMLTILAMAHDHNSYDKRWARDALSFGGTFAKCDDLRLADFVRGADTEKDVALRHFYAETMPCLLRAYAATASVANKPDVVEHLRALGQVTPELAAELATKKQDDDDMQQQPEEAAAAAAAPAVASELAVEPPPPSAEPEAYTMSVLTASGERRVLSAAEAVRLVHTAQDRYAFAEKERAATAAERDAMASQVESLKQECARLRAALSSAAGDDNGSSSSGKKNKRKYRVEDYERCIAEMAVAAAMAAGVGEYATQQLLRESPGR